MAAVMEYPTSTDDSAVNPTDQQSNYSEGNSTLVSSGSAAEGGPTETDYRYGWCGWTPRWMHRFNKASWLLIVLCGFTFAQSLVINGYISSSIGAIERRFGLSSKASGFIVSMYDITCAVFVLFVTYVGGRGHKPKWLTWGLFIMGTGSAIFALPHFTTGLYQPVVRSDSILCRNGTSGEPQCGESTGSDSSLSNYFYLFLAAQIFHGVGALPIYTLGVTLLDESVTTKQTGVYLGLFFALSSVGPAVGYLSGGAFLSLDTDLQGNRSEITSSDPSWVGAWWIGFAISAILSYITAIPMSGFPRELPATAKIRAEKESQAHIAGHEEEATRPNFGAKLADIPKAVKFLFMNPTFVCVGVAGCADLLIISGFSAFAPKILSIQYNMSAGLAAVIVGVCAVPAAVGSTLLGGWLIKRFNLRVRGMLRLCIFSAIVFIAFIFVLLLACPPETVAGINVDYYGNKVTFRHDNLTSPCNADCGCNKMADYNPVCGDNNLQYVDPCHAGCTSFSKDEVFSDCSCLGIGNWSEASLQATMGQCPVDCGAALPLFLIGFFVSMFFSFFHHIPATNTCLRCVPDTQRSFAVGVNWLLARVLGSIPGPLLFGSVLDSSCLLWQDDCGTRGACWLYDRQMLAWKLLAIGVGFKAVSLLFFTLSLVLYRSTHNSDNDKHDDDKTTTDPRERGRLELSSSQAEIVQNAVYDNGLRADVYQIDQ